MNEQINAFATNSLYVTPASAVIFALWLFFQKRRMKGTKAAVLDNAFIFKNAAFVALLVFAVSFLGKSLPGLEETIIVSPADF